MGEPRSVELIDRLGVPSQQHDPERRIIPAMRVIDERAERVVLEEGFERHAERRRRRRLAPRFFRAQDLQQRIQQSFHFGGSGGRRRRRGSGLVCIEDPAETDEELLGGERRV